MVDHGIVTLIVLGRKDRADPGTEQGALHQYLGSE